MNAYDDALLEEIRSWREVLARNIALRNPQLSQRDLNLAAQRTIDRIVFLRICEGRGIEPYGTLRSLLNGTNVYRRLGELFRRADHRYNSGLFHFTEEKGRGAADELTLSLTIDDKVLKGIVGNLYYPDSPYEFSVLPVAILGQVYESTTAFTPRVAAAISGPLPRSARAADAVEALVLSCEGVCFSLPLLCVFLSAGGQ